MARCVSVFADNSLLVLKYIMDYTLIHESCVLYCSYIITLFVYHYIIGHVPTICTSTTM